MRLSAARVAALKALRSARVRDAYIGQLIETEVARAHLEGSERALAVTLARGVVETTGVLDAAIDERAKGKIEPGVRDALRLAAYELLYLRTAARAAVHQGVEAARAARPQAAGLANAVLRRLADAAPEFPWGDPEKDLSAAARLAGYPQWLAQLAVTDIGEKAARQMLDSARAAAPLYVRVNTLIGDGSAALAALESDGADAQQSPPDRLAIRVGNERALVHGSAVELGLVIVADAAAQVAPLAVGAHPGGVIVDVGAGRGTKTVALQALSAAAGQPARIVAVDSHEYKIKLLSERMYRLGVPQIVPVVSTIETLSSDVIAPGSADAVLLDAPCTGTGTLRRHPEIVWRLSAADIARMAELQLQLLEASARLVRPEGVVVYSTCSIARAENDEVVRAFLDGPTGREFAIDRIDAIVPDEWETFRTNEGFFRSWPTVNGPDGHFVARLIRNARAT